VAASCLLIWLTVPPILLYGYSLVSHPVFGPARYTLFVAPAFLLLVGRGLAKLPPLAAWPVAMIVLGLSVSLYPSMVFAPDLKADWRAATSVLAQHDPEGVEPVIVVSTDPFHNVEVETARYYLGPERKIVAASGTPPEESHYWLAVSLRNGQATVELPFLVTAMSRSFDLPGLRLIHVER
jgi:hypothetical protein